MCECTHVSVFVYVCVCVEHVLGAGGRPRIGTSGRVD